jgi:hypothetical protein
MPLNTLRLNHAPSSHPNDRIVFIKPLPMSPTDKASYDTADTFLRAIAAQCLPVMKKHHLAVTTLAEHEPNREFIGRNFNNGEIIELVLRTHSGGWVSFQMVQMVMMHELAHNLHMVRPPFLPPRRQGASIASTSSLEDVSSGCAAGRSRPFTTSRVFLVNTSLQDTYSIMARASGRLEIYSVRR